MAKVVIEAGLDASGFKTGLQKLSAEGEKFAEDLNRHFSPARFAGSVLHGIGLGSGFAVAEKAASMVAKYWSDAAEAAKTIEDSSAETLAHIQRMILISHPEQELSITEKNLKAAKTAQAAADAKTSATVFTMGPAGGHFEKQRSPEDEKESAEAKKKVETLEEKVSQLQVAAKNKEKLAAEKWTAALDEQGKKDAEANGMDWDSFNKYAVPRKKAPEKPAALDKKANDYRENISADTLAAIGGGGNVNGIGPVNPVIAELKTQTAVLQRMLVILGGGGTARSFSIVR